MAAAGNGALHVALAIIGIAIAVIGWYLHRAGPECDDLLAGTRERLMTLFLFGVVLNGWVANALMVDPCEEVNQWSASRGFRPTGRFYR